jgi:hypothetical protein
MKGSCDKKPPLREILPDYTSRVAGATVIVVLLAALVGNPSYWSVGLCFVLSLYIACDWYLLATVWDRTWRMVILLPVPRKCMVIRWDALHSPIILIFTAVVGMAAVLLLPGTPGFCAFIFFVFSLLQLGGLLLINKEYEISVKKLPKSDKTSFLCNLLIVLIYAFILSQWFSIPVLVLFVMAGVCSIMLTSGRGRFLHSQKPASLFWGWNPSWRDGLIRSYAGVLLLWFAIGIILVSFNLMKTISTELLIYLQIILVLFPFGALIPAYRLLTANDEPLRVLRSLPMSRWSLAIWLLSNMLQTISGIAIVCIIIFSTSITILEPEKDSIPTLIFAILGVGVFLLAYGTLLLAQLLTNGETKVTFLFLFYSLMTLVLCILSMTAVVFLVPGNLQMQMAALVSLSLCSFGFLGTIIVITHSSHAYRRKS